MQQQQYLSSNIRIDLQMSNTQQSLTFQDIYQFFQAPPVIFLNQELTVCYVLSVLLSKGESYGAELVQKLRNDHVGYRLSDTILQSSIRFLEREGMVVSYWKKPTKRGRPRRIYQVVLEKQQKAQDLAQLWRDYIENKSSILSQFSD